MLWPNHVLFGNTALRWLIALGAAAALMAVARLLKRWLVPRLAARAGRTGTLLDECLADGLARAQALFFLALAISLGAQFLDLPPRAIRLLDFLPAIALLLQGAAWGHRAIGTWMDRHFRCQPVLDGTLATRAAIAGFLLRLGLWSVVLLLGLDLIGFSLTALLTSLGIGGIAVALAVQSILGDLFASLSITLDQPFVIGDFIIVDECLGSVEFIGLKTTRIRSLSGEQIVISNGDLLKSRIRNFKRMVERRVVFGFCIAYRTPAGLVAGIPAEVKRIAEGQPKVRFDRAHLMEFSDLGLKFEVVYYVLDPDYTLHMDILQAIHLGLLETFRQRGICFSVPSRTMQVPGGES